VYIADKNRLFSSNKLSVEYKAVKSLNGFSQIKHFCFCYFVSYTLKRRSSNDGGKRELSHLGFLSRILSRAAAIL